MAETPAIGRSILTDVITDESELIIAAEFFESEIDVDSLRGSFDESQILEQVPLILKGPRASHAVILGFGAVILWNCPPEFSADVLQRIQQTPGAAPPNPELTESLLLLVGKPEDRVNFQDIWLNKLTEEHIKVISATFGQSIALKHCELRVVEALAKAAPVLNALQTHGKLLQNEHDTLRLVGFALAMKETVLAKIALVDDPPETWQSERLSRLHALLYDHFDIRKRQSGLESKLDFLSDLNMTLLDLLQSRGSHRLELIVIALIVVEVILGLIGFFSGSPH